MTAVISVVRPKLEIFTHCTLTNLRNQAFPTPRIGSSITKSINHRPTFSWLTNASFSTTSAVQSSAKSKHPIKYPAKVDGKEPVAPRRDPSMSASGSSRSKRKEPPSNLMAGRNPKQLRGLLNGKTTGDNTPDVVDKFSGKNPIDEAFEDAVDEDMEDGGSDDGAELALQQSLLPLGPDTAEWQATIQKVVRNVVSIRFCLTCSFDTDAAMTSEATGFVVDSERG
jgi:hypothetical protein